MIGTRYTEELIKEYVEKGFWHPTLLISDLVEQSARDYPDKEAAVDSKTRLTWKEVSQQIDMIARGLLDLGFKRDDVVATQLPNSVEYFLLFFACEKAGVIMATAQHTFRQAEMEPILRQTKAKGIIITRKFGDFDYFSMLEELRPGLPELKHVIVIGDDIPEGTVSLTEIMHRDLEDKYPSQYFQQIRFKPYEVTRIFNTSGTTGTPKCIERPVAPRILAGKILTERMEIGHDDIIMASWNLGAGVTLFVTQICAPLVGAKLVTLEHFTPQVACEIVEREKVTLLTLVPAQMAQLLDYPDLDKHDLSSLRVIFTGTQFLTPELGARIEEKLGCPIVIVYGVGDTSAISSTSISDPQEVRLRTVGRLMDGNEIKIVDSNGNLVPQGEIGEVCVTGPSLVSGYFENPELTRQLWQDGWFCTGDAGKIDEEGHVVLFGRKRDVIIRGGQNIYTSEIEELLMQHPKVNDVAIVRMPDPVMGEKQCAYVIPKRGQTFDFEEMISFLQSKKLATYKLPERLEILAEFPLVAAGNKVDKIRLEQDITGKFEQESKGKS